MGVPILRIPVVALKVLLGCLNNVELVTLSLLSKRADWFLRACGKKSVSFSNLKYSEIKDRHVFGKLELFLLEDRRQGRHPEWNFELCYSVGNNFLIFISCIHFAVQIYIKTLKDMEKFAGLRRNLKIGESIVPVEVIKESEREEKVRTFWNTKSDGIVALLNYFKKISSLPIESLSFAGEESRAIRTVVNHIKSTQTVVKNVQVELHPPISEHSFTFILKNVSATECFNSQLIVGRHFKFNEVIRAKHIEIRFGHWFTLQTLLSSNENELIHVLGSNFTEQELSTFLKKWESGKFPKLKDVKLATKEDYSNVANGLEKRRDIYNITSGHSYGTVYHADGFFHMAVHNS